MGRPLRRDQGWTGPAAGGTAAAHDLPGLRAALIPRRPPARPYLRPQSGRGALDRRMRPLGRDFPASAPLRGQPDRQLNAVGQHHDHNRRPADPFWSAPSRRWLQPRTFAASMRRWRLTSAAVVGLRSPTSVLPVGPAGAATSRAGLVWTFVTRISPTTLQATGMGFFGLYGLYPPHWPPPDAGRCYQLYRSVSSAERTPAGSWSQPYHFGRRP